MILRNKHILITAGPTWVAIDSVRVISNIATGETGIELARHLKRLGAKVTLVLGPVAQVCADKNIRVINYRFFEELRGLLRKELIRARYDIIIHSAAVSDFAPSRPQKGKIGSGRILNLKLKPLPKIISDIRRLAPRAILVMFKLESGVSNSVLVKRARIARDSAGSDIVVANRLDPYGAFIIDRSGKALEVKSKQSLIKKLGTVLEAKQNCPLKRDTSALWQEPSLLKR